MTSRIAIVPARGGSKRIKDKNIVAFCGQPLIAWPLAAARESALFDCIHVSTDSDMIRDVVEALGFPVDFMRAADLADDHTPIMPVLKWVLQQYSERGRRFDVVCMLMPTAPLIEAADLQRGLARFESLGQEQGLIAVAPFPAPVEWAFGREAEGRLVPREPGKFSIRSQDLQTSYFDTGTFGFFDADRLLAGSPVDDSELNSIILPRHKAIDIDEPEDLEFARIVALGQAARNSSPE